VRGQPAVLAAMLAIFIATAPAAAPVTKSFERNPRLAELADNTALDLGPYECEARVPRINCATIFDFSRINYDPHVHRMLVFGGGHAATGRTDVDSFDMTTLTWKSLYESMSCDQVKRADLDPRGFHRSTGHPAARHTYDQNVIVDVEGQKRLMMFSNGGFSGHCHPYTASIQAVASLPLSGESIKWEFGPVARMPWEYAGAAEFDPVSGKVILIGAHSRSSMWVYDPANYRVVAVVALGIRVENSSNLIYFPPRRSLYVIDSKSGDVHEISLDRANWSNSRAKRIEALGDVPGAMRNFAYDAKNQIIGGVKEGRFYALHPATATWSSEKIRALPAGAGVGSVAHHAIDYDVVNNVFVFVTNRASGRRTWAYRYRR
jgi:hypothetical protein